MVHVRTEILIHQPIAIVSAYAANPDKAPEWYVNIKAAEWATEPPLSIGSRIAFKARFMGRDLSYTYEVTTYEPLRQLVMRTAEGPFPMQTTYTWIAVSPEQTRMVLENKGKPSGFSRWFQPFMVRMMRKANTKDLQRLKEVLEH